MTDLERVREGIECVVTEGTYKVAHERHRAEALADLDAHLQEDAADKAWLDDAERRAKGWMERAEKAEAEVARLRKKHMDDDAYIEGLREERDDARTQRDTALAVVELAEAQRDDLLAALREHWSEHARQISGGTLGEDYCIACHRPWGECRARAAIAKVEGEK